MSFVRPEIDAMADPDRAPVVDDAADAETDAPEPVSDGPTPTATDDPGAPEPRTGWEAA